MGFYKAIKKTLTDTVDAVVDKTTTQAQKSRLKLVMRNEARLMNEAYIELGKFFYNSLREDATPELEDICEKIDTAKQRMSRAQEKYREVIQEELINKEITKNEVRENLRSMKEPIAAKAKETAEKVSDIKDAAVEKAADIKEAAAEKASEIKEKLPKVEVGYGEVKNNEVGGEAAEENFGTPEADITETVAEKDELTVQEAIEQAVTEAVTSPDTEKTNDNLSTSEFEYEIFDEPEAEKELSEYSDIEADLEEVIVDDVTPNTIYSYSDDPLYESTSEEAASVPPRTSVNQEFQRTVPVDTASEEDLDEKESPVKKRAIPSIQSKAKKLKQIISGENSEE